MIGVSTFEALCLACSGTTAVAHIDRVAFRTERKIFATLAPDGTSANLCLAPEQQALMCAMAPKAFSPVSGNWGRMGWTTVRFDEVDENLCKTAVGGAHLHALPVVKRPGSAKSATAKPVAKPATAEPVAKTATAEPVAKTATAKPVAKTAAAKPLTKTTTAKPVARTP